MTHHREAEYTNMRDPASGAIHVQCRVAGFLADGTECWAVGGSSPQQLAGLDDAEITEALAEMEREAYAHALSNHP